MTPILLVRLLLGKPALLGYPTEMLACIARETAREMARDGFKKLAYYENRTMFVRLSTWADGSFDAGFRPK